MNDSSYYILEVRANIAGTYYLHLVINGEDLAAARNADLLQLEVELLIACSASMLTELNLQTDARPGCSKELCWLGDGDNQM